MNQVIARQTVNSTCCYCGVGCGVKATIDNDQLVTVEGDIEHPANAGRLCVKGANLHTTQKAADRLLEPKIHGQATSWNSALSYTAERFRRIIQEHGPDSVAFYLSGQLLTEDYYVANKLIKGFIGTANVDTNSRLCMASAVVAHKRAFGGDIVPGCYDDLELADLIFIVGSNMAYAHPIVFQRIQQAKRDRPEMKIVVLDPRRTATCESADVHVPLKPGTDGYFFNGLLAYLAQHDALDNAFIDDCCEGFAEALSAAEEQVGSLQEVSHQCGLDVQLMEQVYEWFAHTQKAVTVFSQGINQSSSGVDKGNAIINCHLASGKIGKPGAAPFSITGQPNAMGGREVGGLANQLAAHMSYADPDDIQRVAKFWQAPNMAQTEGLKAVDMFKAMDEGKIKAVWIMATNPVVSMPNADAVKRALQKCDLVVVSECVENTDTAKLADVLLPATTWGEKNGTVTNSERFISLQKGFLPAPGKAKNDWQIICEFADKMGFAGAFDYQHPVEIFREHAALSALANNGKRGFDISALTALSEQQYQNLQPVQWPVNADYPNGRKRFFDDGIFFTESRRARFVSLTARLPASACSPDQVILNTGRIRDQWHTMSRTGVAAKLWAHIDEPFIDVHPTDVARFGLHHGGLAVLRNRGSRYVARVRTEPDQPVGSVFVPMHWNDRFASMGRVDALVDDVVDPICGQPEFKHCAVHIAPFGAAWHGVLMSSRAVVMKADYWARVTTSYGLKVRFAQCDPAVDWLTWLKGHFPEVEDWSWLSDSSGQSARIAGYRNNCLEVALFVRRGLVAPVLSSWLDGLLGTEIVQSDRLAVLAGAPAGGQEDTGKIICTCHEVGEKSIAKAVGHGCESVESLGKALGCGTGCGSCIPELQAIVRTCRQSQPALGEA